MDEEGIGLVLARASELRSKITNCIHTATSSEEQLRGDEGGENGEEARDDVAEDEGGGGGGEDSLLHIRDAMESLESQLSSLQALQQQQWYEREAALAEIDHSRKKLLKQLKDYKGKDLEVIHEASAFASETVEENNNDLLLPPYPTRPSRALLSDNVYPSLLLSARKNSQNGLITNETKNNILESDRNQLQSQSGNSHRGLRFFINAAAKTVITLVGVVSILGLAGFEPRLRKRGNEFKIFGLIKDGGKREIVNCPPGKVLVMEGGEARCLVKERVEIPFESVVATPDINYGCG